MIVTRMSRFAFFALLTAVLALAGCVEEAAGPTDTEHAVNAEANAPGCDPVPVDITEPEVARALEGATLEPLGDATVEVVAGKRISRAHFATKGGHRDGSNARFGTSIECTSSCGGASMCSTSGCDASASGCSSHSCFGIGCSGGCTKKSVFTPADPGLSDN